jgi:hypothetical protein
MHPYKTGGIRIEERPYFSEPVDQLCVHEFIFSFSHLLEGLQNNCYEKSHKNSRYEKQKGKKVDRRQGKVSATYRVVPVAHII